MPPIRLLPLALAALCHSAGAQQVPGAGAQLQQIPPSPTAPQRAAPQISIQATPGASNSVTGDATVLVQHLHISGALAYSEADLVASTGFRPGAKLSLADLRAMAARIVARYRDGGYFLAQAYLPPQEIKDGAVTIAVLEGRYGVVDVRNQARLSDALVRGELSGLAGGSAITLAPLESRLLRLSDIPGVAISSTLVPGAEPGTSDLVVLVEPGPRLTGSVDADNAGNRYTGTYRLGATLNVNNPAGHGDRATVRVLTSGSGLNYARASYQTRLNRATVGAAYSGLHYELGREFENLQASGTAGIASVYASTPLLRSRQASLWAQVDLDAKTFRDRVDAAATVVDRRAHVLTTTLRGDRADALGLGGSTTFRVAVSLGRILIDTASVRAQDAATARTHGAFEKLAFNLAREQWVSDSVSLHAAVSGQLASKNLDVSEKMELGGIDGVRAYPEGEAYGDAGWLLGIEARWRLPAREPSRTGQLQLVAFLDAGSVSMNESPWASGDNRRTLSGAGVGLNWAGYHDLVVRAAYAHGLGNETASSAPDRRGRLWVQAVKYF
ncbi:MAG TPA: ShlB/FhaC/HecB family hemolysin secretion/activation protein [Rubrivivax sp.]|nr:ShlB/FhaC/HecB family hemolysin secretion/activation protein [Rubrivivax sp.]